MRDQHDVKIREFFQTLANAAPPAPPFPDPALLETPALAPPRQPLGWGQKLVFAAAAILFLVVPFFVFTGGTAPDSGPEVGAPSTAVPTSSSNRYPVTDVRFIEDGGEGVDASFVLSDAEAAIVTAVVARSTETGFADTVSVNVAAGSLSWPDVGEVVMVGDYEARMFRDAVSVTIHWHVGERYAWVIGSNRVDEQTLLAIAQSIEVGAAAFDADVLSIDELPAGYSVFAEPALRPTQPEPMLTLYGSNPDSFPRTGIEPAVVVEVSSNSLEQIAGQFEAGTPTGIRSHEGYRVMHPNGVAFVWSEGPDLTVTVRGSVEPDQMVALAESLEFVSESEWRDTYDVLSQQPAFPTTTMFDDGRCQRDQIRAETGTDVSDVQGPAQVIVLTNISEFECLLEQPVTVSAVLTSGEVVSGKFGVTVRHAEPDDRVLVPDESSAIVYEQDPACSASNEAAALRVDMGSFEVDVPFAGLLGCLRFGLLAPWADGKLGFADLSSEPSDSEMALARMLNQFAASPDTGSFQALPLAETVTLTLGPTIRRDVSSGDLADPLAWQFEVDEFRGGSGTMSALAYLSDVPGGYEVTVGSHPHCAGPPMPVAEGFEELTQISIQPAAPDSCLEWWTVDVFLDDQGDIAGVTLDMWEP
ncbi:MAG: hypothetical protein HKO76_08700 [Acidimicrobiia bacterium]|nr:hypothetical protein [Acidimicrobiia bacterium]